MQNTYITYITHPLEHQLGGHKGLSLSKCRQLVIATPCGPGVHLVPIALSDHEALCNEALAWNLNVHAGLLWGLLINHEWLRGVNIVFPVCWVTIRPLKDAAIACWVGREGLERHRTKSFRVSESTCSVVRHFRPWLKCGWNGWFQPRLKCGWNFADQPQGLCWNFFNRAVEFNRFNRTSTAPFFLKYYTWKCLWTIGILKLRRSGLHSEVFFQG